MKWPTDICRIDASIGSHTGISSDWQVKGHTVSFRWMWIRRRGPWAACCYENTHKGLLNSYCILRKRLTDGERCKAQSTQWVHEKSLIISPGATRWLVISWSAFCKRVSQDWGSNISINMLSLFSRWQPWFQDDTDKKPLCVQILPSYYKLAQQRGYF